MPFSDADGFEPNEIQKLDDLMMGTDELHFVKGADNTITNLRHKEKSKHTNKYAR